MRARRESGPETFAEDIPLIVAVERAHVAILKEFFDIDYARTRLSMGYSIGEITALVCSGVYEMQDLLRPLLTMADECSELAQDVTMGVVFSRGPALDVDAVVRLCMKITAERQGVIDVSSYLAPNTVLLLGQGRHDRSLQVANARGLGQANPPAQEHAQVAAAAHVAAVEPRVIEPGRGRDANHAGGLCRADPARAVAGQRQGRVQRLQ